MHVFEGTVCPLLTASPAPVEMLVAGLRWDVKENNDGHDVDLSCVLLGHNGVVLDVVHPGRGRNDSGSVVHTGDSTTGAGSWDEEQVFIFPAELPSAVNAALLVVASANGAPLAGIRNASCHVSDPATEDLLLHVALDVGPRQSACCVASLIRTAAGWQLVPGCPPELKGKAFMERLGAAACNKWRAEARLARPAPGRGARPIAPGALGRAAAE